MALKASQLNIGDTHVERVVENLSRTQIVMYCGASGDYNPLHAEQHFEYHRPLRPGDVLSVESRPGEIWERESKRAGKLTFRERITEYRDQKGELVVTARSVGVTTERPVDRG